MTPETFSTILDDVAEGVPVRKSVAKHGVNPREFYASLAKDEEMAKQYARAKDVSIDVMADDIIDIADDCSQDTIEDEERGDKPNGEWMARSRLRVDTRKWLMSKLAPKKYGDRVALTGADGGALRVIASQEDPSVL